MSTPETITTGRTTGTILIVSAYSDNFFTKCLMWYPKAFLDGLICSFLDWFSFYFIGIAAVFLIIAIPIIFFFQAPGKQKKMQKLYNQNRLSIIKFMFSCSFSILAALVLGWITNQPGPCIYMDHSSHDMYYFGLDFQLPSIDIVVQTIIATFLFQYGRKTNYFFIDDTNEAKKCISNIKRFLSQYSMKILGVLFIGCFAFFEITYGKSNVLQVLFSFFFGMLVDRFVTIFPVIVPMVTSCICFLVMIIYLFVTKFKKTLYPYDIRVIILDTTAQYFFAFFMLICFVIRHSEFDVFQKFSAYLDTSNSSEVFDLSSTVAETLNEDEEVHEKSLNKLLLSDMKDSVIALILYIAVGVLSGFLVLYVKDDDN